MKRQAYQHPELRDANDNIIQQGAFGKNTALANATNDGWIDYVANDLEALHDAQTAAGNAITTGTLTVSGKTTTGTLEASSATVSGQTTTGTLAAGDTTVTGTIATSGLTVTGETSVPTANEGNSSKAIANTEFVAKSLASLVNGAPAQLNTLNELAKALGNDANFAATITAELAKKLNSNEAESTYATKTEAGVPYQIKRNTAYKVGDVLTSPSLPYYVLRCTVAGTSGAAEPDYTDVALGDKITDGTVTWVVDGYLPLSGGRMTGSIQYVENGKVFSIGNTDPGNVDLGWSWANREGAGIGLRSTDFSSPGGSPGEFSLFARDSANSCSLDGKPDGSLTWDNKDVERVNASSSNYLRSNYIRYESGIQICWGLSADFNTTGEKTVTFPAAFTDDSYRLAVGREWATNWNENYYVKEKTNTNFKIVVTGTASTNNHSYSYVAVGYWK